DAGPALRGHRGRAGRDGVPAGPGHPDGVRLTSHRRSEERMRDYPKLVCPPPGPRARAVIERDARTMSQNYHKDYPLVVDHAAGPVVVDVDGNRYLDFAAGIAVASTGHCHPEVVAAVKEQSERLLHLCATDFYNESVVALAEGLARRAPGPGPW